MGAYTAASSRKLEATSGFLENALDFARARRCRRGCANYTCRHQAGSELSNHPVNNGAIPDFGRTRGQANRSVSMSLNRAYERLS
jgi:hypothetical protein